MAMKRAYNTNKSRRQVAGKSQTSKKSKKNKLLRKVLFIDAGVLSAILVVYLIFAYYYNNHFFGNTKVNGVDTSNMSEKKAEEAIGDQVSSYVLEIKHRNGASDFIYGNSINLHTEFAGSLSELIDQQGGLLWPTSLVKAQEYEVDTMLTYDTDLLKAYVDLMKEIKEENITEPVDATIAYGENGFEIIPEEPGTKVIKEKVYEAVIEAINTLQPTLSLEDAGCYVEPEITSEDQRLLEAVKELNHFAWARITYEFGKVTEVLDGAKISEWLSYDEDYKVTLHEDKIKEYVDFIGKTYNSFGRRRTFQTSYGKEIKVEGGDYGWWLDRSTELKELTELIKKGEQTVKEPAYFQTAQQYGEDDIGDTYVEVNLTAQHLFFYKDGELVVESDFVSGNIAKAYDTPTGTYPVQYKENDAILVGEDYQTPVKYWMPFNRNIGFHDANWRDEFGKDIYLTRGSHGCINLPPKAAKKMFENIKRGVAVVVYELPGTESVKAKATDVTDKAS